MSVVSVDEIWSGRRGSDGITRQRDYARVFEVITDNPYDDATVAGGPQARALGLPGNGFPYPVDLFSRCISIHPEQDDKSPMLWRVTCEYSTNIPRPQAAETQEFDPKTGESRESDTGKDPTSRPENPLDRVAVYKWRYEQTTEILTHTPAGFPILNSADMPYNPPPEDEVSRPVITVVKNLAVVDFDWLDAYADAVNSVKWMGRGLRTCRIVGMEIDPASENGVNFFRVTFTIKWKRETWDKLLPETGFYEKVSDGSGGFNRQKIVIPSDSAGRVSDDPLLLNGNRVGVRQETDLFGVPTGIMDISGVKLDGTTGRGSWLGDTGAASMVFTRWRLKPEKDFSALGI